MLPALRPVRPLALLLALGTAATAPFLVDCSSADLPALGNDAGVEGGASAGPPALRFTYDETGQTVLAHVATTLDAKSSVVVGIRRGTLRLDGDAQVDCKSLEKVDLSAGMARDGERVFVGPDVPEDMLVQYYESEQIGPDATAAQLAAIKAGTDPIVEGCIMRDGKVVARAQASIFRAWDEADPQLLDRLQAMEKGGAGNVATVMHGVQSYGALCERELGDIPFFPKNADGTYSTYDCVKGAYSVTVPITVTDAQGKVTQPVSEPSRCDRPDWLRGSCAPFTHVARTTNAQGTRWVLICRKPDPTHTQEGTKFNDIGLIGHNPKTGKACFFQNGLYGKTDGAHVVSPADPRNAEAVWSSTDVKNCNTCHDNDAFAHSPWLDQAMYPDGHFVVPRIQDDPAYNVQTPYVMVGMRAKGFEMRKMLTAPEAGACTSCHRIADGNTLEAVETTASWTDRSVGADNDFMSARVTPAFRDFARSHWMPPNLGALTAQSFASSTYGRALTFLRGCKRAGTCKVQDMPRE